MKLPIAIMSFDRPHYLERVIQTVIRQRGFGRYEPVFYMFQDGAPNPFTGQDSGDRDLINLSRKIFNSYLPDGRLLASDINLGVAMNFDRAERILFEDFGYDAAVFLEDDMLLQPHYFETLGALMDIALARADVGMVAAYGFRNNTSMAEQRANERRICLMDEHNWAFGITREAWQARDRVVRSYLDLVSDIDYRSRGERNPQLKGLQRSLGRGGKGYLTSQDSMKNLACEVLGIHRINTYTNNALYIGRVGEHSTVEKFLSRGYTGTVLYDRACETFDMPSREELRSARIDLVNR